MADLKYINGFAQLESFMQELPGKIQRNVARGSLRAGALVVRDRARANVAKRSGRTAKSIKVGTRAEGGRVVAYVKVKSHTGRWLEYGTRPHKIKPKNRKALVVGGKVVESVDHPGAKPHPFFRQSLDQAANAALVAAGEYMKKRLQDKHGLDTSDVQIGVEE